MAVRVAVPTTRSASVRVPVLVGALVLLGVVLLLSLAVGARSIPPGEVLDALLHGGDSQEASIVRELRVPRTVLGLLVGVALGLAGALMQALTRNPLADPGLLGVNAGAGAAVIVAIAFLGITSPTGYVWFAFAGAAAASVLVYLIGSAGRGGPTPVRLALAGAALTAALVAFVYGVAITDPLLLQRYNRWAVGSLSGRGNDELLIAAPCVLLGALLVVVFARSLNALEMGDDAARALGAHTGRTRIAGALGITVLCGAATAAAGPIGFIGLTVPHVARAVVGTDQRWVLGASALFGAVLVLGADVVARVVVRPGELPVSVLLAIIGVPVFVTVVRRKRIARL